ncbi:hypothetical protein SNEBB_007624 [Seison nebaliae]|nr:hypothetical protein SNEBB_007624 [Seison nebaliae]
MRTIFSVLLVCWVERSLGTFDARKKPLIQLHYHCLTNENNDKIFIDCASDENSKIHILSAFYGRHLRKRNQFNFKSRRWKRHTLNTNNEIDKTESRENRRTILQNMTTWQTPFNGNQKKFRRFATQSSKYFHWNYEKEKEDLENNMNGKKRSICLDNRLYGEPNELDCIEYINLQNACNGKYSCTIRPPPRILQRLEKCERLRVHLKSQRFQYYNYKMKINKFRSTLEHLKYLPLVDYLAIYYRCIPKKQILSICSVAPSQITSYWGSIMSPNYPLPFNYQNLLNRQKNEMMDKKKSCWCRLISNENIRLKLKIINFELEQPNNQNCENSGFQIYTIARNSMDSNTILSAFNHNSLRKHLKRSGTTTKNSTKKLDNYFSFPHDNPIKYNSDRNWYYNWNEHYKKFAEQLQFQSCTFLQPNKEWITPDNGDVVYLHFYTNIGPYSLPSVRGSFWISYETDSVTYPINTTCNCSVPFDKSFSSSNDDLHDFDNQFHEYEENIYGLWRRQEKQLEKELPHTEGREKVNYFEKAHRRDTTTPNYDPKLIFAILHEQPDHQSNEELLNKHVHYSTIPATNHIIDKYETHQFSDSNKYLSTFPPQFFTKPHKFFTKPPQFFTNPTQPFTNPPQLFTHPPQFFTQSPQFFTNPTQFLPTTSESSTVVTATSTDDGNIMIDNYMFNDSVLTNDDYYFLTNLLEMTNEDDIELNLNEINGTSFLTTTQSTIVRDTTAIWRIQNSSISSTLKETSVSVPSHLPTIDSTSNVHKIYSIDQSSVIHLPTNSPETSYTKPSTYFINDIPPITTSYFSTTSPLINSTSSIVPSIPSSFTTTTIRRRKEMENSKFHSKRLPSSTPSAMMNFTKLTRIQVDSTTFNLPIYQTQANSLRNHHTLLNSTIIPTNSQTPKNSLIIAGCLIASLLVIGNIILLLLRRRSKRNGMTSSSHIATTSTSGIFPERWSEYAKQIKSKQKTLFRCRQSNKSEQRKNNVQMYHPGRSSSTLKCQSEIFTCGSQMQSELSLYQLYGQSHEIENDMENQLNTTKPSNFINQLMNNGNKQSTDDIHPAAGEVIMWSNENDEALVTTGDGEWNRIESPSSFISNNIRYTKCGSNNYEINTTIPEVINYNSSQLLHASNINSMSRFPTDVNLNYNNNNNKISFDSSIQHERKEKECNEIIVQNTGTYLSSSMSTLDCLVNKRKNSISSSSHPHLNDRYRIEIKSKNGLYTKHQVNLSEPEKNRNDSFTTNTFTNVSSGKSTGSDYFQRIPIKLISNYETSSTNESNDSKCLLIMELDSERENNSNFRSWENDGKWKKISENSPIFNKANFHKRRKKKKNSKHLKQNYHYPLSWKQKWKKKKSISSPKTIPRVWNTKYSSSTTTTSTDSHLSIHPLGAEFGTLKRSHQIHEEDMIFYNSIPKYEQRNCSYFQMTGTESSSLSLISNISNSTTKTAPLNEMNYHENPINFHNYRKNVNQSDDLENNNSIPIKHFLLHQHQLISSTSSFSISLTQTKTKQSPSNSTITFDNSLSDSPKHNQKLVKRGRSFAKHNDSQTMFVKELKSLIEERRCDGRTHSLNTSRPEVETVNEMKEIEFQHIQLKPVNQRRFASIPATMDSSIIQSSFQKSIENEEKSNVQRLIQKFSKE